MSASGASVVFGRIREKDRLLALWPEHRLTVLSGPTGMGKSTLISALVLPELGHGIPPVGRLRPATGFPLAALPPHNPPALALLRSWAPTARPTELVRTAVDGWLAGFANRPGPAMVVLDQADDLYRLAPQHRDELVAALRTALVRLPSLRLLVAVRDSHRERLLADLSPGGTAASLELGPLDPQEAVEFRPAAVDEHTAECLVATLLATRTIEQDGSRTGERLREIHPWLLARALGSERPVTRQRVDTALTDALWDDVCWVAEIHDRDPVLLSRALAAAFATVPDTGVDEAAGLTEPVLEAFTARQSLERVGERFRPISPRLLEPFVLLARQAGGREPRVPAPDVLLREVAAVDPQRAVKLALAVEESLDTEILLGDLFHARGDRADSERHYRTASSLAEALHDLPLVGALLMAAGRIRRLSGDSVGALGLLSSASVRLPGDAVVRSELAQAFTEAGDTRAAAAVRAGG